jgi:hypothetical protein
MEFARSGTFDASAMRWLRRAGDQLAFDLLAGDAPVASLEWKRSGGSLATARSATATWTLKRVGFLNPAVTLRSEGGTSDLARVSIHFNYHRIEIAQGPRYRFHRAGVLVPAWQVTTEAGVEVLHVEPVREGRKLVGGAVLVSGTPPPELIMLATLSWYVIVLAWFEDEALVPIDTVGTSAPLAVPI